MLMVSRACGVNIIRAAMTAATTTIVRGLLGKLNT
jgi:hypothetical protein